MNDTEKVLLALVVVAIILLIALYVRSRRHKEGMGISCTEKCSGLSGDARTRCVDDCWKAARKAARMAAWMDDMIYQSQTKKDINIL
jgi:hypothetical protein